MIRYNEQDECKTDYRARAQDDGASQRRNIRADCVRCARIGALFLQSAARATATPVIAANCFNRRCNHCSHSTHASAIANPCNCRRNSCSRIVDSDNGAYAYSHAHAYRSNASANNAYTYSHAYPCSRLRAAAR